MSEMDAMIASRLIAAGVPVASPIMFGSKDGILTRLRDDVDRKIIFIWRKNAGYKVDN